MRWRRCPLSAKTFAVFRKELVDTLRDGRSVFAIFIFPFLLYPAMLFFSSWIQSKNMEAAQELQVRIGVVGSEALPFVVDSLAAIQGVTPVPMTAVPSDIEGSGVNAVLVIPHDLSLALARGDSTKVELLYKDAENKSSAAERRVRPFLDRLDLMLTLDWAKAQGAHAETAPAFTVGSRDTSSKTEVGRYIAALVIPYILIFMISAGAMHTAVDATTGEKERSTLETLLATSATRAELVLGKVMAVLAAALTGAITGITGLWLTFSVIAKAFPTMESRTLDIAIGPDKLVMIFLTLIPVAVFLSATLVAIGCFARSMREGQTYATYVYMAAVFLGLGSFGEQTPPLKNFMIPILNTALLQREILTGTVQAAHATAAIGVTVGAAIVMLVMAVRLFSNEGVLFRN
jgi:sodium transport system permease protein